MDSFKLTSYNVRYYNDGEDSRDGKYASNHWENRKTAVRDVIRRMDADVFATQEGEIDDDHCSLRLSSSHNT